MTTDPEVPRARYGVVVLDGKAVELCAECGFDGRRFDRDAIVVALRGLSATWEQLLADERLARRRPDGHIWCPVEYALHTTETLEGLAFVTEIFLEHDDPVVPLPPVTAPDDIGDDRCADHTITQVVKNLEDEASALAERLAGLDEEQLARPGTAGDVHGDVLGLGRHAVHDALHHILDVQRCVAVELLRTHEVHGGS